METKILKLFFYYLKVILVLKKVRTRKICLIWNCPQFKFPPRKSASIVIVTDCHEEEGGIYSAFSNDGQEYVKEAMIKKGLVLFLESNQSLEMTASENEDIEAYQAFCWYINTLLSEKN